jgi:hypothetical protein
MSDLNHFAISSILGSEIVGRVKVGHGQIASLGDAQRYFDTLSLSEDPSVIYREEEVDVHLVVRAFLEVRGEHGDRGSSDLYIADPERNALFLVRCRELGITASAYSINKKLMYARKNNHLRDLKSVRTHIDYDDYAFACEFAATELRYKTGATIDDIVCDPGLSARFDAIASRLAPGHTSLQYRWAALSIRKAVRHVKWEKGYRMPELHGGFRLVRDPLEQLPAGGGVFLLTEKQKPLYARATPHLRHGVELVRNPEAISAIVGKFWKPNLDEFFVSYAELETKLLRPVEKKLIEEQQPIFNVPRAA